MSDKHPISDEHLNAFVDNQLDADEKSRILDAISRDQVLGNRTCEIRQVREMVQHAYENPPTPKRRKKFASRRSWWAESIAAGLLLGLGVLFGWQGYQETHNDQPQLQAMYLDDEKAFQTADLYATEAMRANKKYLLHISSGDAVRIEQGLDTAEKLLSAEGGNVDLEIVANSSGLNLLRADVSQFAERVSELQRRFDTLTFVACRKAMDRFEREQQFKAELLPGISTTPNALDQILTRLREGWVYISV